MATNRNFKVNQGIQVGTTLTVGNTLTSNVLLSNKNDVQALPSLVLDFTKGRMDARVMSSRTSNASYVAANGLIVQVSANTPRLEWDLATGKCLGLISEEQRTNYSQYSDIEGPIGQPPNGMWAFYQASCVVTNDVWIGPNKTSAKHTFLGDSNVGYINNGVPTPGANRVMTASVYVYIPANSNIAYCNLSLEGSSSVNGGGTANVNLRDKWQRVIFTGVTSNTSAGTCVPVLRIDKANNSVTNTTPCYIYSDCWQTEFGEYASTWIPTTNVQTATRANGIEYVMPVSSYVSQDTFSIAVEGTPKWTANSLIGSTLILSDGAVGPSRGMWALNSSTVPLTPYGGEPYNGYSMSTFPGRGDYAISMWSRELSNTTPGFGSSGTARYCDYGFTGYPYNTFIANTSIKITGAMSPSTTSITAQGMSNVAYLTGTSGIYSNTITFDRLMIGFGYSGGVGPLHFGGYIKKISVFPRVVSNNESFALSET